MYRPEHLRPGDIILCAGKPDLRDPIGLLIVWASDNPFQHAALVGDGELLEAEDQVASRSLCTYADTGWRYRVAGATPQQLRTVVAAARSRLGRPSGYRTLLAQGARIPFFRRLDPHDFVSSALVTWAFGEAGIRLSWDRLPSVASLSHSPLLVGPRPWLERATAAEACSGCERVVAGCRCSLQVRARSGGD